jgi:hypothetical protein
VSAQTVRAQLQAFLTSPPIPGLQQVFLSEPLYIAGGAWNLAANAGWGAVGWPWISDEHEERRTLGAQTPTAAAVGQKEITYKVSIMLLYQYLIPAQMGAEDGWQAPLDQIIEGVKQRLRSDPKAGTAAGLGNVIQQQSQEPGDLSVTRDMPQRDNGKVIVWQRIDTTVTEIITA